MLARDVTVEDFDSEDWIGIGRILRGAPIADEPVGPNPGSSGIVLIRDDARVIKVLDTVRGRLDPNGVAPDCPLPEVARRYGARWAIRLFPGALRLLSARFAARIERSDDFLAQTTKLVAVARDLEAEGAVELFPASLRAWPIPSPRTIKLFTDAICPVGKSVLFAALDGSELTTSVALHRGPHGFDRIVGPERIRRETGLRSSDWRQNSRGVARAVELKVGPLAFGGFAEGATWSRILHDRTPGAWAAAVASRDVVFYPLAPALAIPLGIDIGRVAWAVARDIVERLGASKWGRS